MRRASLHTERISPIPVTGMETAAFTRLILPSRPARYRTAPRYSGQIQPRAAAPASWRRSSQHGGRPPPLSSAGPHLHRHRTELPRLPPAPGTPPLSGLVVSGPTRLFNDLRRGHPIFKSNRDRWISDQNLRGPGSVVSGSRQID